MPTTPPIMSQPRQGDQPVRSKDPWVDRLGIDPLRKCRITVQSISTRGLFNGSPFQCCSFVRPSSAIMDYIITPWCIESIDPAYSRKLNVNGRHHRPKIYEYRTVAYVSLHDPDAKEHDMCNVPIHAFNLWGRTFSYHYAECKYTDAVHYRYSLCIASFCKQVI